MESYVSYGELKNKWLSQQISKRFKNRHVKKSKTRRNQYKANKKFAAKKRRLSQSSSTSNLHKSNMSKNVEQQLISQSYYHIQTTITIKISYHCNSKKKNHEKKAKKVKPQIRNTVHSQIIHLSSTEKKAVSMIKKRTMGQSISAEKTLISRLSRLKFGDTRTKKHASNTLYNKVAHFIQNQVPMIIHVHPSTIPKLLKDTHYRNLFEIGTGSGCTNKVTRAKFEREMFGDTYSSNTVQPKEKPKYGCLNIGLNQTGIKSAHHYGKAYFTLNDATVRWRVSLTMEDSFCSKGVFGTMNNFNHLLNNLTDGELEEICETAVDKKIQESHRKYREIQIHGPVLLKRDIVSLHVPNSEQSNSAIYQFAAKNNIDLIWF